MTEIEVEDVYPLSPVQSGILLHTLEEGAAGIYLEQLIATLNGDVDIPLFQRAWQMVVDRHAALRTSFLWRGRPEPLQVVRQQATIPFIVKDWTDVDRCQLDHLEKEFLAKDRAYGFDLTSAPLTRVIMIKLADGVHRIVWTHHHIVLDGASFALVLAEASANYQSLKSRLEPVLERARPFRDYVAWLDRRADQPDVEHFWRTELAGLTQNTLSAIRPGATSTAEEPLATTPVASIEFTAEQTTEIMQKLRSERITLATAAQGAWALTLSRHCGDDEITIGAASAGRSVDLAGIENMLGVFVNVLPLRAKVDPWMPAGHWLRELQSKAAKIRRFEHVSPLQLQVMAGLPPRQPLFETAVAAQTFARTDMALADLDVSDVDLHVRSSYPIWVMVVPGDRLCLRLIYHPTRVDSGLAETMLGHWMALFSALVGAIDRPLGALEMLSARELDDLRELGAGRRVSRPAEFVDEMFHAAAAEHSSQVAVVSAKERWTYAELNKASSRMAAQLVELGVRPEAVVALHLPRSIDLVLAVLAVLKAGGAFVVVDPSVPAERVKFIFDDANPIAVVNGSTALPDAVSFSGPSLELDGRYWCETTGDKTHNAAAVSRPRRSLAAVIYTSGSTGEPKGVQLEHAALSNYFSSIHEHLQLGAGDTVLQFSSITFDASVYEILYALTCGARLCVVDKVDTAPGPRLAETINKYDVSLLIITPSALEAMPQAQFPSLRVVCAVGEKCTADVVKKFGSSEKVRFFNQYGPTETTIVATSDLCEVDGMDPSIGSAISNTNAYVLGGHLQLLPRGINGQLFIGGHGVSRGYLNKPGLTASRFIADPFSDLPGSRMYATGDRVRWRDDGKLEYCGRIDYQVKIRGFRIEPSAIEHEIRQHHGVAQAVVTPYGDGSDRQLVAYISVESAQRDDDVAVKIDESEHVRSWRRLFDSTYANGHNVSDGELNITGWHSSYSGEQYSSDEMREWVDLTLSRINSLQPQRVFEIGCGTGMLLLPLARAGIQITATDLSANAISYIESQLSQLAYRGSHVELRRQDADDWTGIPTEYFDLVILNSVVQYFPSAEHLVRVMERCRAALKPGGSMFIGDVRSLATLEEFHLSVLLEKDAQDTNPRALWQAAQDNAGSDPELVIDPSFFEAYCSKLPGVTVQLLAKRSTQRNEMAHFRYDAIVTTGTDGQTGHKREQFQSVRRVFWPDEGLSTGQLERLFDDDPDAVAVEDIPDPRIAGLAATVAILRAGTQVPDEFDIRATAERQGDLSLSEIESACPAGYAVDICVGARGATIRAIFAKRSLGRRPASVVAVGGQLDDINRPIEMRPTNDPLARSRQRRVVRDIRADLAERLPSHLVPNSWVVVKAFPLNTNGKIDRLALPPPRDDRWTAEVPVRPRDSYEMKLQQIWQDVLDIQPIGVTENFYHLGGHSLAAIRVASRIEEEFGRSDSLARIMLETPTIERVADLLRKEESHSDRNPVVALQKSGTLAPLFCVHPAGGNVAAYAHLSERLGSDLPFYGLDTLEAEVIRAGVDAVATRYLDRIRAVQPYGPYRLAGWSFGGLVAYDMAYQLAERGEPVELLVLFDTAIPSTQSFAEDADTRARLLLRCALYVEAVAGRPLGLTLSSFQGLEQEGRIQVFMAACAESGFTTTAVGELMVRSILESFHDCLAAASRYTPPRYGGDLVLYRAVDELPIDAIVPEAYESDTLYGWSNFCSGRVESIPVSGDHLNMLSPPHVDEVAADLSVRLRSTTSAASTARDTQWRNRVMPTPLPIGTE